MQTAHFRHFTARARARARALALIAPVANALAERPEG